MIPWEGVTPFAAVLLGSLSALASPASASFCGKIASFENRVDATFPTSSEDLINCGPGSEGASNYALATDPDAPYEMHVVAIYDGSFPPEPGGRGEPSRESGVQVVVYKTLKPAVLVLSSAKPVRWELKLNQDSRVELVILQGRYDAKVSGLPSGVPVLRREWKNTCAWAYGWEREVNRRGGHYRRMIQSLRCATGMRESSFQGCKVGAVFEIPHVKQIPADSGTAFPAACPLDLDPEIPLGGAAAERAAREYPGGAAAPMRPAPPRAVETLPAPRVPSTRGDIRAYAQAQRNGDAAREARSLPERRRNLGRREALAGPRTPAARADIPVRALAILLEGNTALLTHDAIGDLVEALQKGDEKLRSRAADALGQLRPPAKKAVEPLIRALKDKSDRVRASSALALGNIGPDAEKAIRRLKRALDDDNADVRYSAVTALERIGTPKALKALGPRRRR